MIVKKVIFVLIILLTVFFLYAGKRKKTETLPLLNTKWILKEIYETPVIQNQDTAFIIFFDSYKFSGNLGCNIFFGEFNYGKKRIRLDYLGSSKQYCFNMDLEEQFSKVLRSEITNYYIERNKLYFLDKNKTVCKFEAFASSN